MVVAYETVLDFWLKQTPQSDWYNSSETLDREIREQFEPTWDTAKQGKLAGWLTSPEEALAYIILLDQFPRNMFRGSGKAFSSDRAALAAAKVAIDRGWDLRVAEPERQFFYLPLMHSENLCDQERCIRMLKSKMPQTGAGQLLHAKAHREVIRKFGRFPNRNAALDRRNTAEETAFLEMGGYGHTVRMLQQDMVA